MERRIQEELDSLKRQLLDMAARVESSIKYSVEGLRFRNAETLRAVVEKDTEVDLAELSIDETCISMLALRQPMASDLRFIATALKIVKDIERTGDLSNNIAVSALDRIEKNKEFTKLAEEELDIMFKKVRLAYKDSIEALRKEDKGLAQKAMKLEDQIDGLEKKFKRSHIRRLKQGACDIKADVIFVDTLRNLERIGDHADNIASSVITNFLKS
jgi:phosphate transport system regulatory protein PhoU